MPVDLVLELGSGLAPYRNAKAEVIHIDRLALPDVEIVCDLRAGIPFRTNVFDEVRATDIIEHILDVLRLMEEIHRVMRSGALLHIRTTYWESKNAYTDPSHFHFFTEHSFDYFAPDTEFGRKYAFYTKAKFRILSQKLDRQEQVFLLQKL